MVTLVQGFSFQPMIAQTISKEHPGIASFPDSKELCLSSLPICGGMLCISLPNVTAGIMPVLNTFAHLPFIMLWIFWTLHFMACILFLCAGTDLWALPSKA